MKIFVLVASLTVAVALLGCGGGSPTTSGTGVAGGEPTKSQWIRRADPICRSAAKATAPLESRFGELVARRDLQPAGQTVRAIIHVLEKNGERLRRLGVPEEGSKTVHLFARDLETTIEQNIDLAETLEAGDVSHAARLQFQLGQTRKSTLALAHQAGLEVCGTE